MTLPKIMEERADEPATTTQTGVETATTMRRGAKKRERKGRGKRLNSWRVIPRLPFE